MGDILEEAGPERKKWQSIGHEKRIRVRQNVPSPMSNEVAAKRMIDGRSR